jgi:hypothetical protein
MEHGKTLCEYDYKAIDRRRSFLLVGASPYDPITIIMGCRACPYPVELEAHKIESYLR